MAIRVMLGDILKQRGMKFVGTVIIYSYLQAVGVINSHEEACFCRRRGRLFDPVTERGSYETKLHDH